MEYEKYMLEALSLAREAAENGDVPVGCVVVSPSGEIIGRGRNRRAAGMTFLRVCTHSTICLPSFLRRGV